MFLRRTFRNENKNRLVSLEHNQMYARGLAKNENRKKFNDLERIEAEIRLFRLSVH